MDDNNNIWVRGEFNTHTDALRSSNASTISEVTGMVARKCGCA